MGMVKYLWIAVLVSSCSLTPTKPVQLPNGQTGISIDCAFVGTWSSCMNKAAKICGGRYTIWSRQKDTSGGILIPVGTAALYAQADTQEMIVQCDK